MYLDRLIEAPLDSGERLDAPACPSASARLQALHDYQILDTPEEADFNAIVQLAADVFDAPMALISFIDEDRQWLKAKTGLELREAPLNVSICRHGLAAGEVLVVPDATQDDRFALNPFVAREDGIRFYAGAPLRTPSGIAIGMICVLDVSPREGVTERQRRMLITLASQVMAQLELRREVREREKLVQVAAEGEARLRRTLDSLPQITWSAPATGGVDYVSSQWSEVYGTDRGSLLGRGWLNAVHPEDREQVLASWLTSLERGEPYENTYRIRVSTGEYRWVLARARAQRDTNGTIERWYGSCIDVHEQTLTRNSLARREALQRSFLDASTDCIKILKPDGTIEMMNSAGLRVLGFSSEKEARGQLWIDLWPHAARATVAVALDEALGGHIASFKAARKSPDEIGWWDCRISPVLNQSNEVIRLLVISRDITAAQVNSDKLRWASEHDALTSLPNRRAFEAHLQAATLRAMESGANVGLLLMDLDHFKQVNDTLGHSAGDHLLKTFGKRLKDCLRPNDFVARLSGDEFAVILEGVKHENDLLRAGESILARLQRPVRLEGRMLGAGASIGGALFPRDAASAHDLFKNADTALYALKGAGRGGLRMFHHHMREEAQNVASQLSRARMALSEKSVVPFYQQKIDLETGKVHGFEALLRWEHPTLGIQTPDTVAEAFKDYELASKIGELMQTKVFADMAQWLRDGVQFGRISINAAPAEFLRDDYAEKLIARLAQWDLPGSLLEVEVTEHVFIKRGSEFVGRALKLLKEAGVHVALDDFGTGYSSLSHLRDFPVDVVKIDKSFIAKMLDEAEISAIVCAVVNLAESLSIDVVAEGVETAEQKAALREKGCTLGQGYFFGRAARADEVPLILAAA